MTPGIPPISVPHSTWRLSNRSTHTIGLTPIAPETVASFLLGPHSKVFAFIPEPSAHILAWLGLFCPQDLSSKIIFLKMMCLVTIYNVPVSPSQPVTWSYFVHSIYHNLKLFVSIHVLRECALCENWDLVWPIATISYEPRTELSTQKYSTMDQIKKKLSLSRSLLTHTFLEAYIIYTFTSHSKLLIESGMFIIIIQTNYFGAWNGGLARMIGTSGHMVTCLYLVFKWFIYKC